MTCTLLRLLASAFFGAMAARPLMRIGVDPQIVASIAGTVGWLGVQTFELLRVVFLIHYRRLNEASREPGTM